MVIYTPVISGSLIISGSIVTTSGGLPLTGSLVSSGSFTSIGPTIVSGSLTVITGSSIEFQVLDTGVRIGNLASDNHTVTGSLRVSGSITGSGFLTTGTITAQTLIVQTITSSTDFVTGSTRFGSLASNTHQFTGSMFVTGGLFVTSGSVGIGTINPSQLLNVFSAATSNQSYLIMAQTSGAASLFTARTPSNSTYLGTENSTAGSSINGTLPSASFLANQTATALQLGTNNNVRLTIDSSGNVGIGTTTPSAKLEVNVGLNSLKISGRDTYVDSTEDPTNANIYVTQAGVGDFGQLAGNLVLQARTQGTVYRDIIFAGGLSNGDALMTILGEGNVGIGVSPTNLLHVAKDLPTEAIVNINNTSSTGFGVSITAGGGTRYALSLNDYSGAALVRFLANGSVGIGTTDPSGTKLRVEGGELRVTTSNAGIALYYAATYGEVASYNWGAGSWLQQRYNALSHAWHLSGGASAAMTITSGGIIYALNSGVDGTYQPMIGGMYTSNNNETNLISTAVSSVAAQSGFRFDVSNGAGSSARTTSMTINRSSVTIVGSLSKGSGSFRIKHPLASKKNTHQLVHSFIEGPQADLIYSGGITLVNGRAIINIDEVATMTEGTFEALCRNIRVFTSNETSWDNVRGKVEGNILTIECQNTESTDEVSWLVIGERQDEHMFDTEWTDENGKVIVEPLIPTNPGNLMQENN